MRARLALLTGLLAATACGSGPDQPTGGSDGLTGPVTVLAAASLTDVFEQLASRLEADHPGLDVVLSVGGSSGLAQQVVSGAPADVFASASPAPMATVVDAGAAADPVVFTRNRLQIAVPAGNPGGVRGLPDLARPELRVALCAAEVPCGAAAERVLRAAGLQGAPDTLERDVRAVLTKVSLDEVDAGLVYRTDVLAAGSAVEGVDLPTAPEAVNDYLVAVLRDAPNRPAGRAFVDLVLSEEGQRALADAGFERR